MAAIMLARARPLRRASACPKANLGGAFLGKFRSEIVGSAAAFDDPQSHLCYNTHMTESEIETQILARNDLRKSVQLPLLDAQERTRLRSARANRVFERSFAFERVRFDTLVRRGEGWSSGLGKWVRARQQVRKELQHGQHLQYVLEEFGFMTTPGDQADAKRRRTYVRTAEASPLALADLTSFLAEYGWHNDQDQPATFVNRHTGEILGVETGRSAMTVTHDESARS